MRGETAGEGDTRLLVDLLVEQVEFADVIVVNKADLVSAEELERLSSILATFNPQAAIIPATLGQVPLAAVLETGRFDFARAQQAAGWSQALAGHHPPESEEFGIRSFVRRARRRCIRRASIASCNPRCPGWCAPRASSGWPAVWPGRDHGNWPGR